MRLAPQGNDLLTGAVKGMCVTRQDESHDLPPLHFLQLPTLAPIPAHILLPPFVTQKMWTGVRTLTQGTQVLHSSV